MSKIFGGAPKKDNSAKLEAERQRKAEEAKVAEQKRLGRSRSLRDTFLSRFNQAAKTKTGQ